MRYRTGKQWVISIILLMVGLFLLLVNIGVISLEIKEVFVIFIPFLLVMYGLSTFIKGIMQRSSGSLFWGLYTLSYGGLLLAAHWGMISFSWGDWWKLWPILIVSIAISGLFFKKRMKVLIEGNYPFQNNGEDDEDDDEEEGNTGISLKKDKKERKINSYIIGDVKFKDPNWAVEPMSLTNVIGDYYFDFSKAYIPEKRTPIKIKGWIGDIKMLVPEDLPVRITIEVKIGDIKIFNGTSEELLRSNMYYESPGYEDAVKKLDLTIKLGIGDIRIDRV
ncbi:cell wall-active antibiotics response protein LiaF [Falsibacillus pallidus]|uniref:cell wall-active antibiotics response protein LiaF n=1 Tax=Falsibacillus pallidus TaxID=493781 RepID=UPI003D95C760